MHMPGAGLQGHSHERSSRAAMVLTTGLFFLWGMANNLNDVLIAHFRHVFSLTDFQSGLVQSAFYLGYFCFAIPAALVAERLGYKATVILGLLLFGGGALLFLPASSQLSYGFFLFALFVIASGLAFLETAANPMVAVMGGEDRSAQRLNLAQAFNPLGSIAGVALGATLILSDAPQQGAAGAAAVRLPYLAIAIVVLGWAAVLAFTRFPRAATQAEPHGGPALAGYGALLRRPRYLAGVVAQFFYVGAQVGIWSYLIRYAEHVMPGIGAQKAAWLLTLSLALFMVGRFVGAALLAKVDGARLMALFAGINIALSLLAVAGGLVGLVALVATSFFMSIMYPTVFALSLRDLGPLTKAGASMIVMAIIGGAVLTMAMGLLSDISGTIRMAMPVPAFCFAVVALYARAARREGTA